MNDARFLDAHVFFSTREYAFLTDTSVSAASRKLRQLDADGAIVRIARGIWCQPEHRDFTTHGAIEFLIGNERGYLSFLSALHLHGTVSQIPATIQVATTGHSRFLTTRIGRYEFFRIKPSMMSAGITASGTRPAYSVATCEKALLDTLYISVRRGRRFSSLPELDTSMIDQKELQWMFDAQRFTKRIASAVRKRLDQLDLRW